MFSSTLTISQVDDDFWEKECDREAAKRARKAKKAAKRTTKKRGKKPSASELLELDDVSESKVALDSLGSFFNHLIDIDYHQDDTRTSQAIEEKVTIISSDSKPLPRQKIQRVTQKVRFSHPLAHLDPHFLLKQQQHESRRQTRTSRDEELSSSLPNTPRKRQNEVKPDLNSLYPLAGLIR